MKWFQHYSDSYTNLKMLELMEDFGIEGYAIFWLSCELIAHQGENYRIANHKNWKKALVKISKLPLDLIDRIMIKMGELNMVDPKALKNNSLYIPKMAEYSDDYTTRKKRIFGQNPILFEQSSTKSKNVPLHNITLDKITLDKPIAPDGAEVNNLIKLFEPINPTYEKLYANKTQRVAIQRMVKKFGIEDLTAKIKALPKIVSMPYAPRITTPLELENKIGKIQQFLTQEKNKAGKKEKEFLI